MSETFVPIGGWTEPPDTEHLDKHPVTGAEAWAGAAVGPVERILPLPEKARIWFAQHENSCVGFSTSMALSILNAAASPDSWWSYDARALWCAATAIDGKDWTDCNRNTGAFLRSALDVVRLSGPSVCPPGQPMLGTFPPNPAHGITEFRWLLPDDWMVMTMRDAIAAGIPVLVGTGWYRGMTEAKMVDGEYWLPSPDEWLGVRQFGHAYALTGYSDRRRAFWTPNSWGRMWPGPLASGAYAAGAWMPEELLVWLVTQAGTGEMAVIVDKPGPPPYVPEPDPTARCRGKCDRDGDCTPGCVCRRSAAGLLRCRRA